MVAKTVKTRRKPRKKKEAREAPGRKLQSPSKRIRRPPQARERGEPADDVDIGGTIASYNAVFLMPTDFWIGVRNRDFEPCTNIVKEKYLLVYDERSCWHRHHRNYSSRYISIAIESLMLFGVTKKIKGS